MPRPPGATEGLWQIKDLQAPSFSYYSNRFQQQQGRLPSDKSQSNSMSIQGGPSGTGSARDVSIVASAACISRPSLALKKQSTEEYEIISLARATK
mmetsp:Transcript_18943/g.35295  ORF Transcript_18943/g.35295 Transcript_18943/m.35295 type:complete len:96 (+) Transcript_18943:756-1043(+)